MNWKLTKQKMSCLKNKSINIKTASKGNKNKRIS